MQQKNRIIVLIIAGVIIVGAIWYLQSRKAPILPPSASDVKVPAIIATSAGQNRAAILAQKAKEYPLARELTGNTGFINSAPFTLSSLIGKKVILIDFWTYSCINCQRTIPYLEAWYQKYQNQGLEIIGVHSPEFDFEKDYNNVAAAVKAAGITYPVVLDSNHAIWDAYQNEYWPNEYLIDIDGYIVHQHAGEGDYAQTEQAIQVALKERDSVLGIPYTAGDSLVNPSNVVPINFSEVDSPETYFGSNRNEYLINGTAGQQGSQTMTIPASIQPDYLYLGGTWNFSPEFAQSLANATIEYSYSAKNVYFVASSQNGVTVKVWLDGKPLGQNAGADVASDSTVFIQQDRLYSIVSGQSYGQHTLKMEIQGTGLDAYTFTFG